MVQAKGLEPTIQNNRKGRMGEYFVIYDLHDNIIAYVKDLDDLAEFTGCRKKQLKYQFKSSNCVYYHFYNTYRKIYKFC